MSTLRRVGLVFVSCIILLLSIVCPVSAFDYESIISREDLLEFGFVEDPDDGVLYVPSGGFDPFSFMSTFISTQKSVPDFDPNKIPWYDAPIYIQDIIRNGFNDVYEITYADYSENKSVVNNYRMPFIFVRVDPTNNRVNIWAGYNLFLGVLTNANLTMRVYSSSYYKNVCCYRAVFRLSDLECTTYWEAATPTEYGDTELLTYYTTSLYSGNPLDFYLYGGAAARPGAGSTNIPYSTSSDVHVFAYTSTNIGFKDGNYFQFASEFKSIYCSYFVPSLYSSIDSGKVDDYNDAENELINGYNPDDLSDDLNVNIDSNAWSAIFSILGNFISADNPVIMTLVITILSLGFIALILNR